MQLIDKKGQREVCAECGKFSRRGYSVKSGRWFCPACRTDILRHAMNRLRRVRGFPPARPITVPPELEKEFDKLGSKLLDERAAQYGRAV